MFFTVIFSLATTIFSAAIIGISSIFSIIAMSIITAIILIGIISITLFLYFHRHCYYYCYIATTVAIAFLEQMSSHAFGVQGLLVRGSDGVSIRDFLRLF